MYRGTTPSFIFTLPFETNLIDKMYITFNQNDRPQIEKQLSDCKLEDSKIILKLNQEDTLRLYSKSSVKVQIRALLIDGSAVASKMIELSVQDILKDGEI